MYIQNLMPKVVTTKTTTHKAVKKFYKVIINAYKNHQAPNHDRLTTIENAIARIQELATHIASDEVKEHYIGKAWIMFGTVQQRMLVEQSIYMDGAKREQTAQVCMINIGETNSENWEREQLFKPRTLYDATLVHVEHVDHIPEPSLLFDTDPHYCLMHKPDDPTMHLKRYSKPSHKWDVPTAFDTWKGIPYLINH